MENIIDFQALQVDREVERQLKEGKSAIDIITNAYIDATNRERVRHGLTPIHQGEKKWAPNFNAEKMPSMMLKMS